MAKEFRLVNTGPMGRSYSELRCRPLDGRMEVLIISDVDDEDSLRYSNSVEFNQETAHRLMRALVDVFGPLPDTSEASYVIEG